jgi:hypothetical protein
MANRAEPVNYSAESQLLRHYDDGKAGATKDFDLDQRSRARRASPARLIAFAHDSYSKADGHPFEPPSYFYPRYAMSAFGTKRTSCDWFQCPLLGVKRTSINNSVAVHFAAFGSEF